MSKHLDVSAETRQPTLNDDTSRCLTEFQIYSYVSCWAEEFIFLQRRSLVIQREIVDSNAGISGDDDAPVSSKGEADSGPPGSPPWRPSSQLSCQLYSACSASSREESFLTFWAQTYVRCLRVYLRDVPLALSLTNVSLEVSRHCCWPANWLDSIVYQKLRPCAAQGSLGQWCNVTEKTEIPPQKITFLSLFYIQYISLLYSVSLSDVV